jgi:hypothetical protein
MSTDPDFNILSSFLRRMMPDVEGHDAGDPPEAIRTRLDTFASGKADAKERASLSQLLKEHPEYIGYLGRAIRGRAV